MAFWFHLSVKEYDTRVQGNNSMAWVIDRKHDSLWLLGGVAASYALLAAHVVAGASPAVLWWLWIVLLDGPHAFATLSAPISTAENGRNAALSSSAAWGGFSWVRSRSCSPFFLGGRCRSSSSSPSSRSGRIGTLSGSTTDFWRSTSEEMATPIRSTTVWTRLFFTAFHNIQYHAIVWFYFRNRYRNADVTEFGLAPKVAAHFAIFAACGIAPVCRGRGARRAHGSAWTPKCSAQLQAH
jgi:hypothetical protein